MMTTTAPWLLLALGCGRADLFAPEPLAPDPESLRCAPAPAIRAPARKRVPIRAIAGQGVSLGRAAPFTKTAAAFWRRSEIDLVLADSERDGPGEVLGGDAADLDRRTAGLPADEAANLVLEDAVAPLRAWLSGRRDQGEIELVFVDRIAAPSSPVARVASDLAGLTIGRDLPSDRTLGESLAPMLGEDYPTTIFVALRELERMPPPKARWVVAHEIGHALGLIHDQDPTNLMAPEPGPCTPNLRSDQLATLR